MMNAGLENAVMMDVALKQGMHYHLPLKVKPGGVTSICRWISCEFPKSLRKGIIEPSILGHRFLKIGLFFHGKSENSKIRVTIYDDEYRTF